MARTTTSPELSPTRIWTATPCARRTSSAYCSTRLLHAQRGVAGAHGVVLVGERRAEQRHDAVAHHLVDRALVAVDGLHHPLEDRVEELARLLGIAVGEQLHRALEVGEEDGDLLALAFEGAAGGEDLLGEMGGRVGEGCRARLAPLELAGRADGASVTRPDQHAPSSSTARRWPSMSSSFRSSRAASSSWNCRLRVR